MKRLFSSFFCLALLAPVAHAQTGNLMQAAKPAASSAPVLDNAAFQNCLANLRTSSGFASISARTWQQAEPLLVADGTVLPLLDKQPEFTMPVWDYMAVLVDSERVRDGRTAYTRWGSTLQQISARYGVPAPIIAGVWGVESNFGQNLGTRPLLTSLATLSCFGRRQTYFRTELANTLRIVQNGDVPPEKLLGSWAGAFGQTQFMPSTFLRTAVDFDGDGRRDIVDTVPDALASTARFLQQAGWRSGEAWGYEVQLPAGYSGISGRKNRQSPAYWRAQGIRLHSGAALPAELPAQTGLLLPAGANGPAFLVGKNFDALYSYNASENYALAIAHLSAFFGTERSETQTGFITPWPTDDAGLSRAQNRQLQQLLLTRGYDIGKPDGLIGAKTREAIKAEQTRLGMKTDGRAGQKLLRALQR